MGFEGHVYKKSAACMCSGLGCWVVKELGVLWETFCLLGMDGWIFLFLV